MRRILASVITIVAVSAAVFGASRAFFTDTETSAGNTLAAGSIDLGIGNQSYYNGEVNNGTSWSQTLDLDDGTGPGTGGAYLLFEFEDLKPGDWGADRIELEVHDNNSWICGDITLTANAEETLTEPELDMSDTSPDGELADRIDFIWWADDGDSVIEEDEAVLPGGPMGALGVGGTQTIAFADSTASIFDPDDLSENGGFVGEDQYFIGKAWCFGDFTLDPVKEGEGVDPTENPGFTCDGSGVSNDSQSDSMAATIAFSAIQERNNLDYECGQ